MSETNPVLAALDRYGGAIGSWPDAALADQARRAALADPAIRAELDLARALDAGLADVRSALDDEIAASGAVERVHRNVVSRTVAPPPARLRWMAVAAALVIAAGLGSIVELGRLSSAGGRQVEMVLLDPLVFGPTEADLK